MHRQGPSQSSVVDSLLSAHSETVAGGAKMPVRQQRQVSTEAVTSARDDCSAPEPATSVSLPLRSNIGIGDLVAGRGGSVKVRAPGRIVVSGSAVPGLASSRSQAPRTGRVIHSCWGGGPGASRCS